MNEKPGDLERNKRRPTVTSIFLSLERGEITAEEAASKLGDLRREKERARWTIRGLAGPIGGA